jgi:hypothetical protein
MQKKTFLLYRRILGIIYLSGVLSTEDASVMKVCFLGLRTHVCSPLLRMVNLEHLQPFEAPGPKSGAIFVQIRLKRAWVTIFSQSASRHSPISAD